MKIVPEQSIRLSSHTLLQIVSKPHHPIKRTNDNAKSLGDEKIAC